MKKYGYKTVLPTNFTFEENFKVESFFHYFNSLD